MVKVYKIAITGGPCSGKSSSMKTLQEKFQSEFKIFTLPECATTIVNAGVTIIPSEFTEETHTRFTKGICQLQIDLEKFFEEEAQGQQKDVIILTDRGVVDNFAYCTPKVKKNVYDQTGWDENFTCIKRYDLVIHLVTAAKGAEKYYTLENNEARTETPEIAKWLDKKTHEEWMIHPNFVVIDNSLPGFQNKLNRVMNAVSSLVHKKPISNKMFKMFLNWEAENVKLPENFRVEKILENVNYLMSNKNDKLLSIKKRKVDGPAPAVYFHIERFINSKEEDHRELSHKISLKSYFDFMKNKDSSRTQINREILSFSMDCEKTVNVYTLEIYRFNDEKMKNKANQLKKKSFGENAKLDGTIVFLRGFTDTGKFTEGLFENLIPEHQLVTNIKEFHVSQISLMETD
jgi:nicotinamide riboside kinase